MALAVGFGDALAVDDGEGRTLPVCTGAARAAVRAALGVDEGDALGGGGGSMIAALTDAVTTGAVPAVAFGSEPVWLDAFFEVALSTVVLVPPLSALRSLAFQPMAIAPTMVARASTGTSTFTRGDGPRRSAGSRARSFTATAPPPSLRASAARSADVVSGCTVDASTNEGRECASSSTEMGPAGTLWIAVDA